MTMPSTELRNALPSAWVDKLFGRFAALYGRHWLEMWADVPMADVKDAWATELADFSGPQIAAALAKLGKFPPTLPEFVEFCKPPVVPAAHRTYLPAPRPAKDEIPPHIRAEMAKLSDPNRRRDPKDWARQILAEAECGTYRLPIGIHNAKVALGIIKE